MGTILNPTALHACYMILMEGLRFRLLYLYISCNNIIIKQLQNFYKSNFKLLNKYTDSYLI